jgi:hypothetical protein
MFSRCHGKSQSPACTRRTASLTSLLPFGPGFRLCLFVLCLLVARRGSRQLLLLLAAGVAILQVGCGLLLQPQPQLLGTHIAGTTRQLAARGLSWLRVASAGAVHVGCGLLCGLSQSVYAGLYNATYTSPAASWSALARSRSAR